MASVEPYETGAGTRYRVRYRGPDRRQTDKRGFTTKKAALEFLARTEVAKADGQYVKPADAKVKIAVLGDEWLGSLSHLKPSSREPLEIAWRLYVAPRWGTSAVSAVKHSDVQRWVSELTLGKAATGHASPAGPKSATVVLRAYGVLASILDVAVKDRRITVNPARGVKLPRKGKKTKTYLTHMQVARLAAEAGPHETLVLLLAYTGIRWGEAVGLRVQALDLLRRRLVVQENAVRVNGGIVVGTPKTHEARSVPIPAFLVDDLSRLCEGKRRDQLVFGAGDVHQRTPTNRDGWFQQAVKRSMVADPEMARVTLHDLRHAAASFAVSAGANVKAVQRMLGHASAAMTLDVYADLFDDDLDGVAVRLDSARAAAIVGKSVGKEPKQASDPAPIRVVPGK